MMGVFLRRVVVFFVLLVIGLMLSGCSGRSSLLIDKVDTVTGNPEDANDTGHDPGFEPDVGQDSTASCVSPDRPEVDQKPWTVGSANTLDVLTWNIRQFPTNSTTTSKVADLIWQMGVDLVAVQEIADIDAFHELLCALPGYEGVLSTDQYSTGEYQKTGYIYRSSQITVRAITPVFTSDNSAFPRPPLKADIDVHLPDGAQTQFTIIDVHLKAGVSVDDAARRRDAVVKLKGLVDGLVLATPGSKVMIVGDFNDSPDDSAGENVFTAFLDDSSHYTVLTLALAQADDYSYIPYPSLIDNMIVTSTLLSDTAGGYTEVLLLDEEITQYNYENQVSDHRPVVTILPLQ